MRLSPQSQIRNRDSKYHLMTLSVLASTFGGIVRPICFAAFKLITNSNFVDCSYKYVPIRRGGQLFSDLTELGRLRPDSQDPVATPIRRSTLRAVRTGAPLLPSERTHWLSDDMKEGPTRVAPSSSSTQPSTVRLVSLVSNSEPVPEQTRLVSPSRSIHTGLRFEGSVEMSPGVALLIRSSTTVAPALPLAKRFFPIPAQQVLNNLHRHHGG